MRSLDKSSEEEFKEFPFKKSAFLKKKKNPFFILTINLVFSLQSITFVIKDHLL